MCSSIPLTAYQDLEDHQKHIGYLKNAYWVTSCVKICKALTEIQASQKHFLFMEYDFISATDVLCLPDITDFVNKSHVIVPQL